MHHRNDAQRIRTKNNKLKNELGVTLRYPNYRAGLQALYDAEEYLTASGPG